MLKTKLTSSSIELDDGRLCHVYTWRNLKVRVKDDAESVLLVIELFSSSALSATEKQEKLMGLLFADPEGVKRALGRRLGAFLADIVWDSCGLDISLNHVHKGEYDGKKVMDWEQDSPAIKASLMQAYGVSWDDIKRKVTYSELCDLLSMIPTETPFGQALHYRTADCPRQTKYNAEEVKNFRKCKRYWSLRCGTESDMDRKNREATAMFDALAGVDDA